MMSDNPIKRRPLVAVYVLGLVVAAAATIIEVARARDANFMVFADATRDFWRGVNPYNMDFVDAHGRYYLYTPVFSVLFYPFAALPHWMGALLWNLGNYTLFALAVATLPRPYAGKRAQILLYLLPIVAQSVFSFQYNMVVAYVFLFSFNLLERGHGRAAVLLIMISATTKVYGIVSLLLLFCYPHTFKRLCEAAVMGIALLCLPVLKVGVGGLAQCYLDWWAILTQHQTITQYASLLYAWPLRLVLDHYRVVQLVTVAGIIALFFVRRQRWSEFGFRAIALGVLMGWIIVLGDSSETHTYVIALAGYMLWYHLQPRHTTLDRVLFWAMLVFFGIIPSDVLVPSPVHHYLNDHLFLDVYLYATAWTRMLWTMALPSQKKLDISTI